MKLWVLNLIRKACLSIGKSCSKKSRTIRIRNAKRQRERLLELVSKEALSSRERKELDRLMEQAKDDIIIL